MTCIACITPVDFKLFPMKPHDLEERTFSNLITHSYLDLRGNFPWRSSIAIVRSVPFTKVCQQRDLSSPRSHCLLDVPLLITPVPSQLLTERYFPKIRHLQYPTLDHRENAGRQV